MTLRSRSFISLLPARATTFRSWTVGRGAMGAVWAGGFVCGGVAGGCAIIHGGKASTTASAWHNQPPAGTWILAELMLVEGSVYPKSAGRPALANRKGDYQRDDWESQLSDCGQNRPRIRVWHIKHVVRQQGDIFVFAFEQALDIHLDLGPLGRVRNLPENSHLISIRIVRESARQGESLSQGHR